MAQVPVGGNIVLSVNFYEYVGGPAVDPDDLELNITLSGDIVEGPILYPETIVRVSAGNYRYTYAVPTDASYGTYTATWSGVIDTVSLTGIEEFLVTAPGGVSTGSLGTTYIFEFAGELDPLYLDPAEITIMFPEASELEIAEYIHVYSQEIADIFDGQELTFAAYEYIKAATACALSRIYGSPLEFGGLGDADSFSLGDLQVSVGGEAGASGSASSRTFIPTTWCELAATLRSELLRSRTGMKAVLKGSNYANPIPSRHLRDGDYSYNRRN